MLTPREIPSEGWKETLNTFDRLHHGEKAHVSLIEPGGAPELYAKNAELLGLTDERHGQAGEEITLVNVKWSQRAAQF